MFNAPVSYQWSMGIVFDCTASFRCHLDFQLCLVSMSWWGYVGIAVWGCSTSYVATARIQCKPLQNGWQQWVYQNPPPACLYKLMASVGFREFTCIIFSIFLESWLLCWNCSFIVHWEKIRPLKGLKSLRIHIFFQSFCSLVESFFYLIYQHHLEC